MVPLAFLTSANVGKRFVSAMTYFNEMFLTFRKQPIWSIKAVSVR